MTLELQEQVVTAPSKRCSLVPISSMTKKNWGFLVVYTTCSYDEFRNKQPVKFWDWEVGEMLAKTPSTEFSLTIEAYWEVWKSIETQIQRIEQKLKERAKSDPKETIYCSAPGIGSLSARILSSELGDLRQFSNERQLFSYTGLTPSEFSSGDTVRKGHITRQGNKRVRYIRVASCLESD